MRWHGNKKVVGVRLGTMVVKSIYKGAHLVWTMVSDIWRRNELWRRNEKW